MGFFDKLQKPGHTALKQQKGVSHTETRKDLNVTRNPYLNQIQKKQIKTISRLTPERHSRHSTPDHSAKRKSSKPKTLTPETGSNSRKRASSTPQRQDWGSDDEGSDSDLNEVAKRVRRSTTIEPDPKRRIQSRKAFSDEDGGRFDMVHAANIASLVDPKKYRIAFPDFLDAKQIQLQYPSASQQEKYELVVANSDDDFKALEDIREVIEVIIAKYLPGHVQDNLNDESTGLVRRIKRASQRLAGNEYIALINEWNETLNTYREDGTIEKNISEWKTVDLSLCEFILTQAYARTVSLKVDGLRKYKAGENNVYGELLPKFVSKILREDTKMKADQVFIDFGSGVGNVVLQAALEVGCASWGCEITEHSCELADLQKKEFEARCRLWGLSAGEIHLERGDFLANEILREVLPKADVVLVNNQAFQPEQNDKLIHLFLDLKDGATIVSLKSFAPVGQKNKSWNSGAIYNIFDVVEKRYYDHSVSWTNASGTYYVAKKDSKRMRALE
ncbi:uncharacterized protein KY384_004849 [Bacidia gigantensis]|uniref:uncharacterized protein n=1 Tax=Bacidia gigantensis TaxID=2732470 RepID=UPI001D041AC9|nr:uncharacterized protein KY384_004849 [Bacidia gigantensis]KAG8530347.1 hypothetical protein KY384_004849 [Bacidia gigantensis]